MSSTTAAAPASRKLYWAGWVLTILPALLLVATSISAISGSEGAAEGFEKYGYPAGSLRLIGVVELVSAVLFLIPPTAYLGAILLTGYLGGAVATHVHASEGLLAIAPIVFGAIVWLALLLRDPRLRPLLPLTR
ncbi:MAG TPA: DoxX family protein [Pirellulales bacterium]|nr:DoxX family protein [Pirellulales bacterium]